MTGAPESRLVEVTSASSPEFLAAFAIYEAAIPKAEQKTRTQIIAGLAHPDVRFWALERGAAILGLSILYAPRQQDTMLLEYLAVSPDAQGGGLGSTLFSASFDASRTDPGTVLLIEVDSEREDVGEAERAVRLKRKQFYRRLGCREVQGFAYILPLENYGPPPEMSLLVLGAADNFLKTARLRRALTDIYRNVYACAPDDARIAAMFEGHGDVLTLI